MVTGAKGTKLNRRGLQTRHTVLVTAIDALAAHGVSEPVSASLITRKAGVTWGVVQHQFGDVDGLWAAVLRHILDEWEPVPASLEREASLGDSIAAIVLRFWRLLGTIQARAVINLRSLLPSSRAELEAGFPQAAAAVAEWDRAWVHAYERAFEGLPVDQARRDTVRMFLPGALSGLRAEFETGGYVDQLRARDGLIDVIVAYLSPESGSDGIDTCSS